MQKKTTGSFILKLSETSGSKLLSAGMHFSLNMVVKKNYIFFILVFIAVPLFSQNKLRLSYERFGKVRSYELHNGDILDYKLKGKMFYKKHRIANLQDSMIVFSNDSVIKLNQIKAIRFMSASHLAKTMQDAFIMAGSGFVILNTVNNAIYSRTPLIDPAAVYISAGLVGTGLLIKALRTKHIRITKNKSLKIIEANYQNLNQK